MRQAVDDKRPSPVAGIRAYVNDTVAELRKVSWPSRQEATNLTLIVLGVTVAMAAVLGGFDLIFARLIGLLVGS